MQLYFEDRWSIYKNLFEKFQSVRMECSDVTNLWKPKIRQQIFLDSFSSVHVRSWGERQTDFCVCSGINR